MTNQSKYFTFIGIVFCLAVFMFGIFVYFPSLNFVNKPNGQVLGAREVKAPDIEQENISSISLSEGKTIELQTNLDDKTKLLVKFPATFNGKTVTRDSQNFYISCPNGEMNQISVGLPENFSYKSSTYSSAANVKSFLKLDQTNSSVNCKLSDFDVASILDNSEIRSTTQSFVLDQVTSFHSTPELDYILTGNCIKNGITSEQLSKFSQPCSLWSAGKNQIYPELVTNDLRDWFSDGDIYFYNPKDELQITKASTGNPIPFRLVNINVIKREANVFYIKDGNLKLIDFREIRDINKFTNENTQRIIALNLPGLEDYYYRQNLLPIMPVENTYFSQPLPKQTITCFWTNTNQLDIWYKDAVTKLPLARNINCNIGQMISEQNVKSMKLTKEELTSGDYWYMDSSAFNLTQTIVESTQKLSQSSNKSDICQTAAKNKYFFEKQLCPFNISSSTELQDFEISTKSNSAKAGKWATQELSKDGSTYYIFTQVHDNGLWVYWYKLQNDVDLTEKKIELNTIMQKVVLK